LDTFNAQTFTELFDGTKNIEWQEWIGVNDEFPVKGHSIKSKLFSVPDCQKIVKKAVVEKLKTSYGVSWFEETGVKKQIEFFIFNDKASLMIDISGVPLHKRGYRAASGEAPLRETLAAAMAKIARPREDVLFWDCFCGSATIPIEAAMLMTNTAPNVNNTFISEQFDNIDQNIFVTAREEAHSLVKSDIEFKAYASDVDTSVLKIAQHNIKMAGMEKHIDCFEMNALDIDSQGRKGSIVCNPPYGERLSNTDSVFKLYSDMGKAFKRLDRWQIYILTNDEEFERKYGRRADKIRRLYNGMLRCNYYQFFKPINK
ncbi:MAG: class I SAM-dependent RNA methyltransferase, partial [Clostridia bacterium]|nr:class I SAM-dependent RNA methyltransferase [Clostridia bacterium]